MTSQPRASVLLLLWPNRTTGASLALDFQDSLTFLFSFSRSCLFSCLFVLLKKKECVLSLVTRLIVCQKKKWRLSFPKLGHELYCAAGNYPPYGKLNRRGAAERMNLQPTSQRNVCVEIKEEDRKGPRLSDIKTRCDKLEKMRQEEGEEWIEVEETRMRHWQLQKWPLHVNSRPLKSFNVTVAESGVELLQLINGADRSMSNMSRSK